MIDMIAFKVCLDSKKNSEALGRMFIAYHSNINEILDIITSKNIMWIAQDIKQMCESPTFLSTDYCYYKKIFVIIPSFQKQNP